MPEGVVEQSPKMSFEEAIEKLSELIPAEAWPKDLPEEEKKLKVSFFERRYEKPDFPRKPEEFGASLDFFDAKSKKDIIECLLNMEVYMHLPRIVDPFTGPRNHNEKRRPFEKGLREQIEQGKIDPYLLKVWNDNGLSHNKMGWVEQGIDYIKILLEDKSPEVSQLVDFMAKEEFNLRKAGKNQEADRLFEYKEEKNDAPAVKLWKKLIRLKRGLGIDPALHKDTVEHADEIAAIGLEVLKTFEKKE